MAATFWVDSYTGHRFDADELAALRTKAHAVYAANGHIFEDEADALAALGAVPVAALVLSRA